MEQEPKNNKLELSPYDFDQSPHGWREIQAVEGFERAAEAIIDYVAVNKERILKPSTEEKIVSLALMNFHAGQMLALAGKIEATEYFRNSLQENSECWNAYVDATIGFLEKEPTRIKNSIAIIEASVSEEKESGNLGIVENFLKALQEGITDYLTAYSMPRE